MPTCTARDETRRPGEQFCELPQGHRGPHRFPGYAPQPTPAPATTPAPQPRTLEHAIAAITTFQESSERFQAELLEALREQTAELRALREDIHTELRGIWTEIEGQREDQQRER